MGRSEIRSSGVERQSCNDQPPTGSKPLRSNPLSDTRCRGSPQAPLFSLGQPAPGPVRRSAHYAGSGVLRGPSRSRGFRRSPLGASVHATPAPFRPSPHRSLLFFDFFWSNFSSFIPGTFWKRGTAGLGFDVRTRNGRDQLQCLIVFHDHQVPQTSKVPDHYSSRHDLVLVFH